MHRLVETGKSFHPTVASIIQETWSLEAVNLAARLAFWLFAELKEIEREVFLEFQRNR
jgi:hypothetical protein